MLDDNEERDFQEELAPRIHRAIKLSGLKQHEIATMIGVSSQAVYGWKTTGKINKPKLVRFAAVTRTHLHWLMTGEGEPRNHVRALYQVADRPDISEQANKSIDYIQSLALQGALSDDDFLFLEQMARRLFVSKHSYEDPGRSQA